MKKLICLLLIACLLVPAALADNAPKLDDKLFDYAKKALVCLSSGEYERLVSNLPFSDVSPSASEWQNFAGNYQDLTDPQSEYAVAYWRGTCWNVAVPVQTPDNDDVEVLVLTSYDGTSFSGYRYSDWASIQSEYADSEHICWNKEYFDSEAMVFVG